MGAGKATSTILYGTYYAYTPGRRHGQRYSYLQDFMRTYLRLYAPVVVQMGAGIATS